MKTILPLALSALGIVLIAGCGGGSGGSATEDPTSGGTLGQYGPIETRGQINGTPIVRDLGRISTVALAGVLTDATYRPQGNPDNETAIAVGGGREIRYYMENGEFVSSFRPDNTPADGILALPNFSKDGTKLYYFGLLGIYSVNVADPSTATLVISGNNMNRFAISPDGLRIAYNRVATGETDQDVYMRNIAGGTTKRLTNNTYDDFVAEWIDNERVAIRAVTQDEPTQGTNIVNVNNLTSLPYTPFDGSVFPIGRASNGRLFLNSASENPLFATSITDYDLSSINNVAVQDYLEAGLGDSYSASVSPDGTRWAVNGDRVFTTELAPKSVNYVTPDLPSADQGVNWQPALGVTKFVGSGGRLGTASAGIVATNRSGPGRNGLASLVSWDCQTRSTSTISDDATTPGVGSKSYTIEADRLTALRFANRPLFQASSIVSASGTANGAIVTVDAEDGIVTSIVVFQETRGAKPTVRNEGGRKIVEGSIQSVWNAKGENLAPQGASRVQLDQKGNPTLL
ncbi:hypothetical protein EON81_04715 [bacterium]|nr:MAG: hypothetical protein EON81_04715 [bacterium]